MITSVSSHYLHVTSPDRHRIVLFQIEVATLCCMDIAGVAIKTFLWPSLVRDTVLFYTVLSLSLKST